MSQPLFNTSISLADNIRRMFDNYDLTLHVSTPAIVKSFDPVTQTISAQVCTDEFIYGEDGEDSVQTAVPIIPQIPVYMFGTKNFSITSPIKEGDECLLIFADSCIDDWYANGGEGKIQQDFRRHDHNDPFALVGFRSQPNALGKTPVGEIGSYKAYDGDGIQIRNISGTIQATVYDDSILLSAENESGVVYSTIEVVKDTITLSVGATTNIVIKNGEVTITSDKVNLSGSSGLQKLIDERFKNLYDVHTHSVAGVMPGTSTIASLGPSSPIVLANHATSKTKAG